VVRRRARGFTYLAALLAVAILGVGLALAGEVWHTARLREKEAELLFVGNQYRKAIERYYLAGPRQYPRSLEDLLKDPRKPGTERHLRRLYPDPIRGASEWGVVRAPDGGIMGVHSLSEEAPLKRANFRVRDAAFEGARRYADWSFVYLAPGVAKPAARAR
jgi:type II secretory pathway pseudopilin PulG